MKQRFKLWLTVAILTIICGAIVMACLNSNDDHPSEPTAVTPFIPQAPDYADATMWITEDDDSEGTGADDTGVTICYNPQLRTLAL